MSKLSKPSVVLGQWIDVGNDPAIEAVVSRINKFSVFGDIEIVFMSGGKPVNIDIFWINDCWSLEKSGAGGYAEDYPRLNEFVMILKEHRRYSVS